MTMPKNGDDQTTSHRQRPPPPLPSNHNQRGNKMSLQVLMAGVCVLSVFSITHNFHLLPEASDHAMKTSLKEFTTPKQVDAAEDQDLVIAPPLLHNKSGAEQLQDKVEGLEMPIDNPPVPNGTDTFAACLLVMDDNNRIVEWLAYHYHILPLRYLIIAVDPRSKTSPTAILNRWRRKGMYIQEWTDFNIFTRDPSMALRKIGDDEAIKIKRDRHRIRQRNFYQNCLIEMGNQGRSWVSLIDADEYLVYNHAGGDEETYQAWEAAALEKHKNSRFAGNKRIPLSQAPPSPADEGRMISYIDRERKAGHPFFQSPCITVARMGFGAVASTEDEIHHKVPAGFDPFHYDSLRFRKHAPRQDFVRNGLGKTLLDVSRFDYHKIRPVMSLHRPIKEICSAPWKDEWSSGLRINHYIGSWESYSFRDDSRRGGERSWEAWKFKSSDADDTDDNIRPWLDGFVNAHGKEEAQELLKGAGLPRDYKNENIGPWHIDTLEEILTKKEVTGSEPRVAFDTFVRNLYNITTPTEPTR